MVELHNSIDIHSALLNRRYDPSLVSGEIQAGKLLWIYIKLYTFTCIVFALYAIAKWLGAT